MTRPEVEIDREALRETIDVLFMAATGADTPRGSVKWVAEKLGLHPVNVTKWFSGNDPTRQTITQLAMLEELVTHEVGKAAIVKARLRLRGGLDG